VNVARSDPPTPRAQARARRSGGSRSERRARRSEGSGGGSAENRGIEQQGLSPPATSKYSLSGEGEEEESNGGQAP
jgi:hypothetical protein